MDNARTHTLKSYAVQHQPTRNIKQKRFDRCQSDYWARFDANKIKLQSANTIRLDGNRSNGLIRSTGRFRHGNTPITAREPIDGLDDGPFNGWDWTDKAGDHKCVLKWTFIKATMFWNFRGFANIAGRYTDRKILIVDQLIDQNKINIGKQGSERIKKKIIIVASYLFILA